MWQCPRLIITLSPFVETGRPRVPNPWGCGPLPAYGFFGTESCERWAGACMQLNLCKLSCMCTRASLPLTQVELHVCARWAAACVFQCSSPRNWAIKLQRLGTTVVDDQ